ncbi:maleylpyruvate isomerase N-terminal domain-containing protein [Actinoplanes sp. NPDC051851]|uniref:maleylpyruvate isomerase N-terminal domain-containing protein n=1 Tax=Actinoplanes sp. NPDC051851 TaxID=3154753 RepID=UPI00344314E7
MDFRRTFRSAAIAYAGLAASIPPDRLDVPGLGDWSLRDLIGHTVSSALRQVPAVLATPAPQVEIDSPEGYFAYARSAPPALVAAAVAASTEDARRTGASLGTAPADMVSELVGRATQALANVNDDDPVVTSAGGMRVRDWIPTRTFELVVHGLDAAAAASLPLDLAPDALTESLTLAARVAALTGQGSTVLRTLTGRGPLPATFSVL